MDATGVLRADDTEMERHVWVTGVEFFR
jgi:hypothetical protein